MARPIVGMEPKKKRIVEEMASIHVDYSKLHGQQHQETVSYCSKDAIVFPITESLTINVVRGRVAVFSVSFLSEQFSGVLVRWTGVVLTGYR